MSATRRPGACFGAALLAAWLGAGRVDAGEQLTVKELLARSSAVIEVSVTFAGARALRVEAQHWLWRGDSAEPFFDRAGGTCLPTRDRLRQWRSTYANFPAPTRARWAQLARAKGYRAVVFLRQQGPRLVPCCELEALSLTHVFTHPGFAAWRLALQQALAGRAAPRPGAAAGR